MDWERFRTGAVRINDGQLQRHLGAFFRAFPIAKNHREMLRLLGSDFVHVEPSPVPGDTEAYCALVRFGDHIERTFGITREVLAYYSPYKDLQLRTYQRLTGIPSLGEHGQHTPDLFLLHAPDPRIAAKLDDWTGRASHTAVSMPAGDARGAATRLWQELEQRLTARNLYEHTGPVTGPDFFGRDRLIRQLVAKLRDGEVCGVYGLRKTGKTSLMQELGRRAEQSNQAQQMFVLRDLETLPSVALGM